jgi:hypothetical protein
MIVIKIEGNTIDFDGEIAMQWNNPMLTSEVSYSLQSTFNDTPEVRRVLGFINMPNISDNKKKELISSISFFGITLIGTIVVTYQAKKFNWYFKANGDFWTAVKTMNLSDIPFETITHSAQNDVNHYGFISDCNANAGDTAKKCVFPVIYNPDFTKNWKWHTEYASIINPPHASGLFGVKDLWVPMFYLQYVIREIFKATGLYISRNILEEDINFKRLILYNNFAINNFRGSDFFFLIDQYNVVTSITNAKECEVTMALPLHVGFENYSFVQFDNSGNVPELAGKAFQIEIIDEYSFKLINEDSTNYTKLNRQVFKSTAIEKDGTQTLFHLDSDLPDTFTSGPFRIILRRGGSALTVDVTRLPADTIRARVSYKVTAGSINYNDEDKFEGDTFDGEEDVTTYSGSGTVIAVKTVVAAFDCSSTDVGFPVEPTNPVKLYRDEKETITYDGEIIYPGSEFRFISGATKSGNGVIIDASSDPYVLIEQSTLAMPNMRVREMPFSEVNYQIDSNLKINPLHHLPEMTISSILNSCKIFGIEFFVNDNSKEVKILSKKNIILDQSFIDITQYSSGITDVENSEVDGFILKDKIPSEDSFYVGLVKMQEIDELKYIKKEPAQTWNDLPTSDEQNAVRLVIDQEKYYVFVKGFLNVADSWLFLTHAHIYYKQGNGDLSFETDFSSLFKENVNGQYFPSSHDDGLVSQLQYVVDKKLSPRLLIYRGAKGGISNYASPDINGPDGLPMYGETFSLNKWDGEDGTINQHLKEIIHWELNVRKDCKAVIQWPHYLIANFNYAKKYRERGVDYLVKSIKATIRQKNIKWNETELVKV